MEYGPLTKQQLGVMGSGEVFRQAVDWSPDQFTLPFPERLSAVVEDFFELPVSPSLRNASLKEIIMNGSARHGFSFSRTTLNEWLEGRRDPSVTSSDTQTRENIYRLCAALDFDLELSMELFEKVFFSRAFNPKSLKEFCFFFQARKEYDEGTEGSPSWYEKGQQLYALVSGSQDSGTSPPITETSILVSRAEYLSEQEFIHFVSRHRATFQPTNWNDTARKMIREYTIRCSNFIGKPGQVTELKQVAWDTLINHMIGYTQRSSSGIIGAVSNVSSLPDQLVTNFPTGQTLRKICIGDESSFDKMYKVLCLLLFYFYFSSYLDYKAGESGFQTFLRFANHELQKAAFPELYPGQPYAGMLLFSAAQDHPIQTLQHFLRTSVERESEIVLVRDLSSALPENRPEDLVQLVRCTGYDPFTVQLIAAALRRRSYGLETETLLSALTMDEDRSFLAEQAQQSLMRLINFEDAQKQVLRYASVLPPDGISDEYFRLIFPANLQQDAEYLAEDGWLVFKKGVWKEDHRIRSLVADQEWFPRAKNCRVFIDHYLSILPAIPISSTADCSQLSTLAKRISSLDGLDSETQSEVLHRTAARIRPIDSKTADQLLRHRISVSNVS